MPQLTGGEIVGRALTQYGVTHAAGIPGHGVWSLLDGLLQDGCDVPMLQVFHEQSAVHWPTVSGAPAGGQWPL